MNKVILVGRLTKDPDVHINNDKTVVRFNLAVDRRYKTEGGQAADFPSVVAFGKTAEFIKTYFYKGMRVGIDGRIQTGDYVDKDGIKHYTTDVIAENVEFAESKKAADEAAGEDAPPSNGEWLQVPEGIEADLPFK